MVTPKTIEPEKKEDPVEGIVVKMLSMDTWDALTKAQHESSVLKSTGKHKPQSGYDNLHDCLELAFNYERKDGWKFIGQVQYANTWFILFEKEGGKYKTPADYFEKKEEKKSAK